MDIKNISQSFTRVLERSLTESASLPFIKHTLSSSPIIKPGEEFQALTIGGSMCQSDRMKVDGKIHSLNHKIEKQPAFVTREDFLSYIATVIDPSVSAVGLNFAYPLIPIQREGVLDGKLVSGSKENGFGDMVGKPVGEAIEKYIKQKTGKTIRVAVANDTICLLLSGLTKYTWDEIAAGIVGTGVNFALFLDKHTAVNLETANFDGFQQTPEGKEIDKKSASPGAALFEKEVSGAYLYKHFNLLAEKEGMKKRINSTEELDSLAEQTTRRPEGETTEGSRPSEILRSAQDDKERMALIAHHVLTRSAQLAAAQVAGILEFQKRDLTFVMQGSLFWKGYQYKETVEETVKKLSDYHADFIKIKNADLLGAAKLVV